MGGWIPLTVVWDVLDGVSIVPLDAGGRAWLVVAPRAVRKVVLPAQVMHKSNRTPEGTPRFGLVHDWMRLASTLHPALASGPFDTSSRTSRFKMVNP